MALTIPGAVLSSLWPTAALLLAGVGITLVLCLRAPAYAFLCALVLYSFEGSIKMRLSVEGAPSPLAVGAAMLDLAFLASLLALLAQDRGRSLVRLWDSATRWERAAGIAFAAWLCISVPQILLGGDLVNGLEGFRLTQMYVPAALGGIVLASRLGADRLTPILLGVVLLATCYAAVRGITGPSFHEQAFARLRTYNTEFGDVGRNVGSFTGPVSLVSFLVPVAVACLVIGFLSSAHRVLSLTLFVLAMIGIIASYVRSALLAVVAGAAVLAGLLLIGSQATPRRKAYAVGLVVLVLGGGYAATLAAGEVSPLARERAERLANPFTDQSVKSRLETWEQALEKVSEEPLGTGVGTVGRATLRDRRATTTDSSYVKILQEQGVPGGLLFLVGLGGLVVALGLRLARLGLTSRPLGIAAFAGFTGFLVLMLMGEYVEQPGKLLAWTLFGVAAWEAWGRGRGDAARSPAFHWRNAVAGAKRPPQSAVALLAGCAVLAGLVAVAVTASREDRFQRTSALVVPGEGIPNREGVEAVGTQVARNLLGSIDFAEGAAKRIDFMRPSEVTDRLRMTTRSLDDTWEFRVASSGPTPREAGELAQATMPALRGLGAVHAGVLRQIELGRLRSQLADEALDKQRRQTVRRQLRALERSPTEVTARAGLGPAPSSSRKVADRLSGAIAGEPTPAPNLAWSGVAAVLFGLAAAGLVLLLVIRAGRGVGDSPNPTAAGS